MNTRLCLVRHGETAWNAEHRVQGQLDVPLNDVGQRQALAVAEALRGESFDALYSSDLQRVRQTAAPAAAQLGMEPVLDAALRERHYGIFQTLTYAEVKVRYAEDYARFARRDPEYAFRTGESLRAFAERSVAAIRAIAERHSGQSVLVFTHGGVLDEVYRHIGGLAVGAPRDFGIPNCGINRLEIAEQWRIGCWAEVAHLENALDDLKE
jgi:probable phosphoglycerate mutase